MEDNLTNPITLTEAESILRILNVTVFQNIGDDTLTVTISGEQKSFAPRECLAVRKDLDYVIRSMRLPVREISIYEIAKAVVDPTFTKYPEIAAINDYEEEVNRENEIRREARFIIMEETQKLLYKLKQLEEEHLNDELYFKGGSY